MRRGRQLNRFACSRGARQAGDRARPSGTQSAKPFLTGAAFGGLVAYLLDPDQGHCRRRLLVDRTSAGVRRRSRRVARAIRIAFSRGAGQTRGFVHRLRPPSQEPPDDVTLADRVKSVVFRDPRFPKGQISINAEEGDVFLRGQVDGAELIHDLEAAVRSIPGVRGVENLLHLPGTPAPAAHSVRRES